MVKMRTMLILPILLKNVTKDDKENIENLINDIVNEQSNKAKITRSCYDENSKEYFVEIIATNSIIKQTILDNIENGL